MAYICMDRGTDKCPCALMEAGQCYTCSMIQTGKCSCSCGWQGVCPYTEYKQRGSSVIEPKETRNFVVAERHDFSPSLSVVTLKVPFAYSTKCREKGAFMMVCKDQWQIPISVIESYTVKEEEGLPEGRIKLAINAAGPKTIGLLKRCSAGSVWNVRGPYFTGLVRKEIYDPKALSIVAAKGIALMPLLNMKQEIGGNLAGFYLDRSKLPEEFESEYLSDLQYEEADLTYRIEETAENIHRSYKFCMESTDRKPNVFLMVSPYFLGRLTELLDIDKREIIAPNHVNMCCGEGICGACSHTDAQGVTVRGCKCFDL